MRSGGSGLPDKGLLHGRRPPVGFSLEDEIWEIIFHFQGIDNLERTISLSEITYVNMLALMETEEGYIVDDYTFYVKEEGKGAAGYLNRGSCVEEQLAIGQVGQANIISIDEAGVLLPFEECNSEELYVVPICTAEPGEDLVYINIEGSINLQMEKGKEKVGEDEEHHVNVDDEGLAADYDKEEEDEMIEQFRQRRKQT
ncbi:hypothetical protein D1007_57442 [Hordeum vulgare]|nr:hypothetical protein D1007_57442 [Hordeum vulgare]